MGKHLHPKYVLTDWSISLNLWFDYFYSLSMFCIDYVLCIFLKINMLIDFTSGNIFSHIICLFLVGMFYLITFDIFVGFIKYFLNSHFIFGVIIFFMILFYNRFLSEYDFVSWYINRNKRFWFPEYKYTLRAVIIIYVIFLFSQLVVFTRAGNFFIYLYVNLIYFFIILFLKMKQLLNFFVTICFFFFSKIFFFLTVLLKKFLFFCKYLIWGFFNVFSKLILLKLFVCYSNYCYILYMSAIRWYRYDYGVSLFYKTPINPLFLINYFFNFLENCIFYFLKRNDSICLIFYKYGVLNFLILVYFFLFWLWSVDTSVFIFYGFIFIFIYLYLIIIYTFWFNFFYFFFFIANFFNFFKNKTISLVLLFFVFNFIILIDFGNTVDIFNWRLLGSLHRHRTSYTLFISGVRRYSSENPLLSSFWYDITQLLYLAYSRFVYVFTFTFYFLKKIFFLFIIFLKFFTNYFCNDYTALLNLLFYNSSGDIGFLFKLNIFF